MARFYSPDRKVAESVTLNGATSRLQATRMADQLLVRGLSVDKANLPLLPYLKNIWTTNPTTSSFESFEVSFFPKPTSITTASLSTDTLVSISEQGGSRSWLSMGLGPLFLS